MLEIIDIHFPPTFGLTPKAHIHRLKAEWVVTYPTNWPITQEMVLIYDYHFAPWLRKMNAISAWQPDSFVMNNICAALQ